jgi:hypothetical protein
MQFLVIGGPGVIGKMQKKILILFFTFKRIFTLNNDGHFNFHMFQLFKYSAITTKKRFITSVFL